MFRRSLVEEIGGLDESLAIAEDYEFWLRLAEGREWVRVSDVTSMYFIRDDGSNYSTPDGAQRYLHAHEAIYAKHTSGRPLGRGRPLLDAGILRPARLACTPRLLLVGVQRRRERGEILHVRHRGANDARVGVHRQGFVAEIVAHARDPRIAEIGRERTEYDAIEREQIGEHRAGGSDGALVLRNAHFASGLLRRTSSITCTGVATGKSFGRR